MDLLALEVYFCRPQKIQRLMTELNNEYHGINPDIIKDSGLEFHREVTVSAESAALDFKIMFSFENELREQIRYILEKKYKKDEWLEKINLDDNTKQKIQKRQNIDRDTILSSRIEEDLLAFCTLPDLIDIMIKNWKIFEKEYPRGRRFVDNVLREINKYRIVIAHMGELNELDRNTFYDLVYRFHDSLY